MSDNDLPTETDPRFPSGAWRGYWIQDDFTGWMEVDLTFRQGKIIGEGTDPVSRYTMRGTYDLDTGKVVIRKHYLNQYMLPYAGVMGGDGHMSGLWEIPSCNDRGPWRLWPKGKGGEYQSISGMADEPRVVTSWEEFEVWFEEVMCEECE
ncbi:MAG: hypothetical protein AAF750_10695 [Planctomycetota bacterium]